MTNNSVSDDNERFHYQWKVLLHMMNNSVSGFEFLFYRRWIHVQTRNFHLQKQYQNASSNVTNNITAWLQWTFIYIKYNDILFSNVTNIFIFNRNWNHVVQTRTDPVSPSLTLAIHSNKCHYLFSAFARSAKKYWLPWTSDYNQPVLSVCSK